MTPRERAFWVQAQRRASTNSPEIARALLRAFEIIRETIPQSQLLRIIESGNIDLLFREVLTDAILDRAFLPVRNRIRSSTERNVRYFARDIPKAGATDFNLGVAFDILNPRVIDAVKQLDTKVMRTLKDDIREVVRSVVQRGIEDGTAPKAIARELRSVIGLSATQEKAIQNFRAALEGKEGSRNPLDYKLRDKRFDRLVREGKMTPERIERAVEAYRRKSIALNAETNARTASLDAMKLGQRLSWEDAAEKGLVDRDRLVKTWVGVKDDRERPEHLAMEGEEVGFDSPFSNGEMLPGASTYNCRCIPVYKQQSQ